MPNPDPFTQVYQAIWSALTGFAEWTAIVEPTNQIRFDGKADPVKYQRTDGDLPEAALIQTAFKVDLFGANSLAVDIVQNYRLACTLDDLNLETVNQLKWTTMRALAATGPNLGLPKVVRKYVIRDGKDDPYLASSGSPGMDRWMTVLTFAVDMRINRAAVVANAV